MKQNQFAARFCMWLSIPLAFSLYLLTVTSSCTGKKKKGSTFTFSYDTLKKSFAETNCITLSKEQVTTNWVPQFTDTSKSVDQRIAVIKFSTEADPVQNTFVVKAQAYNTSNDPLGNEITLGNGIHCGKNLPRFARGLTNDFVFSELRITKPDGTLIDGYENIILVPGTTTISGTDFLTFKVLLDIGTVPTELGESLPCPPCVNCKICPDDCKLGCLQIIPDTTSK